MNNGKSLKGLNGDNWKITVLHSFLYSGMMDQMQFHGASERNTDIMLGEKWAFFLWENSGLDKIVIYVILSVWGAGVKSWGASTLKRHQRNKLDPEGLFIFSWYKIIIKKEKLKIR